MIEEEESQKITNFFQFTFRSTRSGTGLFGALRGSGWRHCQAQLSHYRDAETNYRMVSGEQFSASQIKQSFTDNETLPHSV